MTQSRTTSDHFGYDDQAGTQIRNAIVRDTGRTAPGAQAWIGTPVTLLPLSFRSTLNAMVSSGEIEVVEVRMAEFARFA